jgi:predicted alpha/beta superfamily hydrolase
VSEWLLYQELHGDDNTITGTVLAWPELESPQLGGSREILVYLPPSLAAAGPDEAASGRRYPVIYFHDGQNVFDERTSYVGELRADETLEELASEGLEAIAVAVPNNGEARMDEYNPWRSSSPWWRGGRLSGGKGDAYLDFLVETVKPLIDASFPTSRRREDTGIAGSSMGGLISLYAVVARGDVFSLAGVMSPSLAWGDYRILRLIEEQGIPPARVHLDIGGREGPGTVASTRRLRDLLVAKGMLEGRDLQYVEDVDAGHDEEAWAQRLPDALRFLLAETRS